MTEILGHVCVNLLDCIFIKKDQLFQGTTYR